MTTPRKSTPASSTGPRGPRTPRRAKDLQPQATGASDGSPATSVMKQFAKTRAESSGKP